MNSPRILLIEDSLALRTLASAFLKKNAYRVDTVGTRVGALRMLDMYEPDVAILDLGLDDGDGSDLIPMIAERQIPLIVTSSRATTDDRVEAIELGADDYLVKPVDMRELLARVRRFACRGTRRNQPAPQLAQIALGSSTIDIANRVLVSAGQVKIPLTASEFRLLNLFLETPGAVVERHTIGRSILSRTGDQSRAADVMVSRLRRKIEALDDGHTIRTLRGRGYSLAISLSTSGTPLALGV